MVFVTKKCDYCGELILPTQRYYSARNEHVMCSKVRQLGLELGDALHKNFLLRQYIQALESKD